MDSDETEIKNITEIPNEATSSQGAIKFECGAFMSSESENEEEEESGDSDIEISEIKLEMPTIRDDVENIILKSEEKQIIDQCRDPELAELLLLNRNKNLHLIMLYKKVKDLLIECQGNIEVKKQLLTKLSQTPSTCTNMYRLAAPYFKDQKLFPCLPNSDTIRRVEDKELNYYDITACNRWSKMECDILIRSVRLNYNVNRQRQMNQNLIRLRTRLTAKESSLSAEEKLEVLESIAECEDKLRMLKEIGADDVPPVNSNEHVDWHRIADVFLKEKHTVDECKTFWHIYLHPLINKSEWTDDENERIHTIAAEYDYQDWDNITLTLGTNRSAFSCCLHYFSNLCDKFKKSKFTKTEDDFLLDVIETVRIGTHIPWKTVAQYFTDRSKEQLAHRYRHYLSSSNRLVGKFSEAEDILLHCLHDRLGKNFSKYARYMPHRSQMQIKNHFYIMEMDFRKGSFTVEDDEMIMKCGESQDSEGWNALRLLIKRPRAQLIQRYLFIKRFLEKNPNASLSKVPRRKHHKLQEDQKNYHFIRHMANQFKDKTLPTLKEIETMLGIQNPQKKHAIKRKLEDPEIKNLDAMLIDFFSKTYNALGEEKIEEKAIKEVTDNMGLLLGHLGVELEIPNEVNTSDQLDELDVRILNSFKSRQASFAARSLVPPNVDTLTGLKTLLLANKRYKPRKPKSDSQTPEEDEFSERFSALFNWPSFLSMEPPNNFLLETELCLNTTEKSKAEWKPPQLKLRKRKLPKQQRSEEVVPAKTIKIIPTRMPYPAKASGSNNLIPIDKSVVQELLKNQKNPTMYLMDKVKDKDGNEKTVVKSVNDKDAFLKWSTGSSSSGSTGSSSLGPNRSSSLGPTGSSSSGCTGNSSSGPIGNSSWGPIGNSSWGPIENSSWGPIENSSSWPTGDSSPPPTSANVQKPGTYKKTTRKALFRKNIQNSLKNLKKTMAERFVNQNEYTDDFSKDLIDIQKLDLILKSENSKSCDIETDPLLNDEELLNELVTYEKNKFDLDS